MKKVIKILMITLFMIILISLTNSVQAASASISADKTQVNVGESVTLKVTINAAAWNLKVSGTGVATTGYADNTDDATNKTTTKTLSLDTKTAGTKVIKLSGDVTDGNTDKTTNVSGEVTVVVNEKKEEPKKEEQKQEETKPVVTKSSDANLKSITVGEKRYNSPSTTLTADSVNSETSSIKIEAQTSDSKARVTGTGTKELVTGTNVFTLKVTAENGATKQYTVKVTKLAEETTNPNIMEDEENNSEEIRLKSLSIEQVAITPEFDPNIFEYNVKVIELEELKIHAEPNSEDIEVEIVGDKELVEGENIVTITLTKDEKKIEYIIRVNNESIKLVEENQENKIDNNQDKKTGFIGLVKDWWNKSGTLTILFAGILGLLSAAISFVITIYKYTKPSINASRHLKNEKN